jgi:hypothetical protein
LGSGKGGAVMMKFYLKMLFEKGTSSLASTMIFNIGITGTTICLLKCKNQKIIGLPVK